MKKIEGYEQALKTTCNTAFGYAVTRGATPCRPANQGNRPAGPYIPRGRGEQSRHVTLRGKYFRCAKSNNMIPQCSYPETGKCNTCGATGHITPASFNILSLSDGLVLMDSKRIVLPLPSVKPILKLLHASHSGITKTTSLARGLYFWPGMTNDIKQLVSTCQECTLSLIHI